MTQRGALVRFVSVSILALACSQSNATDCGSLPEQWDADGDGISDATERNNAAEQYHPFDPESCDRDPTVVVGEPHDGGIQGAINLKDVGVGYRHYRGGDPSDGDDWGSLALINCIEAIGRRWGDRRPRININDLSVNTGGRFSPHRSHQNGLDVDVRYVRNDGADGPLDLELTPDLHDADATREMLEAFFAACPVHVVFADLDSLGFKPGDARVRHANGHSNHFHVRLAAQERTGDER